MILLGSFLHRETLAELVGKALEDRFGEQDAVLWKRLVSLNAWAVRVWSDRFASDLFLALYGQVPPSFPASTKAELKDLVVANPPVRSPRIDELIEAYRRFPEDFYRETPYDGRVFTLGDPPRYVGSRRIKRVRRIAEKTSRRLIDYLFDQIRQRADELAEERARRMGVQKERLVTPPDEMAREFAHAERRVLKSIRDRLFVAAMPLFHIDDIVGVRVLMEDGLRDPFARWLESHPDLSVVDEKHFTGNFRGNNMVVALRLPMDRIREFPVPSEVAERWVIRGVVPRKEDADGLWKEFLDGSEGHVRLELLQVDYEGLLESEIGRSMHEAHILEQRENAAYKGRLATNLEALMDWLLAYALSPVRTFEGIPIVLRGTYLPDYFDRIHRRLYQPAAGNTGLTL
ncbi:hypothetical protein KBD49_06305 [Myxococcota bacterium]|jgi:hypothetical protein|nr:hypothetical protein [Myxococcota bacterium]